MPCQKLWHQYSECITLLPLEKTVSNKLGYTFKIPGNKGNFDRLLMKARLEEAKLRDIQPLPVAVFVY